MAGDSALAPILKAWPFHSGNRKWFMVLLGGYTVCNIGIVLLALVLNAAEGKAWMEKRLNDVQPRVTGQTAIDECWWFIVCTFHGIGFGEFMPHGVIGRLIGMLVCSLHYWFIIFMMCIVMLSQLPGETVPTLQGVWCRMFVASWPSYVIFIAFTCSVGATIGPYVSHDPLGGNDWPTGIYYYWCATHGAPYGDIYPNTPYGRIATVPAGVIGLLYPPFVLALIAVRRPTAEQHVALLDYMKQRPMFALGRGYVTPQLPEETMQECEMGLPNAGRA